MTTHWAYTAMAEAESRLRKLDQFRSSPDHPARRRSEERQTEPMFLYEAAKADRFRGGMVEDDHLPFMARGVEILHLIPTPFPAVWHTINDDGAHLDTATVEDWAMLTTAFAAEWMELEGFFDAASQHAASAKGRREVEDKSEL